MDQAGKGRMRSSPLAGAESNQHRREGSPVLPIITKRNPKRLRLRFRREILAD